MRKHNSFHPRCNWQSFVIDYSSQTNIAVVEVWLQAGFIGTDILVIRSKIGCGATHLLGGIVHELESRQIKLFCPFHEWIGRHLLGEKAEDSERQEFLNELNSSSYLVIDHVTSFDLVRKIGTKPGQWLGDAILGFISSGGKLICAHSDNDTNHIGLVRFLSDFTVSEVHLNYPSYEAAQNMALAEFSPDFVAKYGSKELYEKCSSVREYEGLLMSLLAKEEIGVGENEISAFVEKWPRVLNQE